MSEINFDERKRRLENYAKERDLEFNEFLEDHATRVPRPKPKKVISKTDERYSVALSPKFWLAFVTGICSVGAAGLRVYQRIFEVASLGQTVGVNDWLPYAEALLTVGAVNIGLVALSYTFAYKSKKVSDQSLWIGVLVAFIISLVSGLGQSFAGLKMDEVTQGFDWVLAISLALVSGLEWVSGDMMGVESVAFEAEKRNKLKAFEDDFNAEEDRFDAEYSVWLSNARKQFGIWKAQFVSWADKNYAEAPASTSEPTEEVPAELQSPREVQKAPSKLELCYAEIGKFVKKNRKMPKLSEIQDAGFSAAYASQALNRFTEDFGERLISEKLINQERLDKAKQYNAKFKTADSA